MGYPITPVEVTRVMTEALAYLCAEPFTPESLWAHFAPRGAVKAGGTLLTSDRPFFIKNEVMTSLRLFEPFDRVVWWAEPKPPAAESASVHLVLGAPARIVPYEDFISAAGLGPGAKQTQTHPLSDIPWEHRSTSGRRVIIQQIVWAGEFVGKVGELTVFR